MIKIIQKGNALLCKISSPVAKERINSAETKKLIEKMREVLASKDEGIALAAPQIGVLKRVFIVSPKIFQLDQDGTLLPEENRPNTENADCLIFINPEIIKKSQKKKVLEEGCLSVDGLYGEILRYDKVTIRATDERGNDIQRGASGILAEIFQHEIDHLNGILFTDTAKNLHKIDKADEQ